MLAKGLRSRQARARASILATVLASATTRVVVVASSLPRIAIGAPTGIVGIMRITVVAMMLMHRDHGAQPATLWCLVDKCVLVGSL